MGESLIIEPLGVFTSLISATETLPMLKCLDYRIREYNKSVCNSLTLSGHLTFVLIPITLN